MVIATAAELAEAIKLEGIAVKRALRGKFAVEQLEVLAKAPSTPSFFLATGFLTDLPLLGRTVTSKRELMFRLLFDLCAVVNKLPAAVPPGNEFAASRDPGPATPSRPDRPAGAAKSGDGRGRLRICENDRRRRVAGPLVRTPSNLGIWGLLRRIRSDRGKSRL